jgi:FtsZ-binding cell division protein ZapB
LQKIETWDMNPWIMDQRKNIEVEETKGPKNQITKEPNNQRTNIQRTNKQSNKEHKCKRWRTPALEKGNESA